MSEKKNVVNVIRLNAWMNSMKVNFAVKNVTNIEKSIVKNIKIDTTRNKEKDMKKMKSIEKESRGK